MGQYIGKLIAFVFGIKKSDSEKNLQGYLISEHIYNTTSRKGWKRK